MSDNIHTLGGALGGNNDENPEPLPEALDSGQAQNQVLDILGKAAEGNTLGSDEAASQVTPDSNAQEGEVGTAFRSITFWRSGFTFEDGPLLLYTDPDSAKLLESIQQGRAPPEALNVRVGQPVELRVFKRLDQDYVPPPPGPFVGLRNRKVINREGTPSNEDTIVT